jgi:hypothetical protein
MTTNVAYKKQPHQSVEPDTDYLMVIDSWHNVFIQRSRYNGNVYFCTNFFNKCTTLQFGGLIFAAGTEEIIVRRCKPVGKNTLVSSPDIVMTGVGTLVHCGEYFLSLYCCWCSYPRRGSFQMVNRNSLVLAVNESLGWLFFKLLLLHSLVVSTRQLSRNLSKSLWWERDQKDDTAEHYVWSIGRNISGSHAGLQHESDLVVMGWFFN